MASKGEATARNCNCEALADHEEETDLWTAARTLRELEHQTRTAGRCTSTMVTRGRATTCAEVRSECSSFKTELSSTVYNNVYIFNDNDIAQS